MFLSLSRPPRGLVDVARLGARDAVEAANGRAAEARQRAEDRALRLRDLRASVTGNAARTHGAPRPHPSDVGARPDFYLECTSTYICQR